jgi:WD40 repeat protein
VAGLAFSPDGRRLAAVGAPGPGPPREAVVTLYDPATGEEVRRLRGGKEVRWEPAFTPDDRQPLALAFSPDGGRLALGGPSDVLRVWDLAGGREREFSPLQASSALTGVAFSPDGRRLASVGYDGRVQLWDAVGGHELLALRGNGAPNNGHYTFAARVAFSRDGRHLAANDWDGTVFVWDAGPAR